MPAPQKIINLVNEFKENEAMYKDETIFDEENTKVKFLNPFLEALGWNVRNVGLAPWEREVIFEGSVKDGKTTIKPDYEFLVDGETKFYLEAKKPSRDIVKDKTHAYQVRIYGWNAKIPLSILSDFEEFAIYDTRIKPEMNQSATIGRVAYYHYTDYIEKWDEIYNIFSKEAVISGKFDEFAGTIKSPGKGETEVDDEFLKDIEEWRLILARNIALRNKELTIEELNYAVQLIIDRIIFLRIAEDRKFERYKQLLDLLKKPDVYKNFTKICKDADDKYNSGLFHFKGDNNDITLDTFTLDLNIDDEVFKKIFKNLYYPNSPYRFDIISTEILGKIYEQFLGKIIRLTDGHHAKIDEKPEVKKAGGVYYTPQYIVNYIVKNTIGEKIEGLSPNQISKIKIIDPACGSGSFLIRAYQYLLDYHLKYYLKLDKRPKNVIYQLKDGSYRLTISEKKRILKNNIYGVDIDTLAVEVTKLSLLLKVLEDQNKEKVEQQKTLFHKRALPNLSSNIKNGNSLIESDIIEQQDLTDNEIHNIKPFDWKEEFPEIFEEGGFDCVIGNPPYGYHEIHSKITKTYLKKKYVSSKGSFEHYFIFYELSLSLLNDNGLHGFIVPVTWISIPSALSLRKFILDNYCIDELNWFNYFVFDEAKVNTLISIIKKTNKNNKTKVKIFDNKKLSEPTDERKYPQDRFITLDYSINIFEDEDEMKILEKIIKNSFQLNDIAKPCSGYNPYEKGKGKAPHGGVQTKQTVEEKPYHSNQKLNDEWKPEIVGRNLSRYYLEIPENRWVKYGPWLAAPRKQENFMGIRLLVQEVTGGEEKRIIATYYEEELYYSRDVIPIKVDSKEKAFMILAILNSNLITWYHHKRNPKSQKALFPKILVSDLKKLPLSNNINWNSLNKGTEKEVIESVQKIIELNKKLHKSETPTQRKLIKKQIDVTNNKIDDIVYKFYNINTNEIKKIEENL